MAANFAISAVVVVVFLTRLAQALRNRERELAQLREQSARNEGIIALATHAASVAHELNTPLGTMTLLVEEWLEHPPPVSQLLSSPGGLTHFDSFCGHVGRELPLPPDSQGRGAMWQLLREASVAGLAIQIADAASQRVGNASWAAEDGTGDASAG